ncbi:hypothetical protein BGZ94_004253, partial [Podila epigama]
DIEDPAVPVLETEESDEFAFAVIHRAPARVSENDVVVDDKEMEDERNEGPRQRNNKTKQESTKSLTAYLTL